MTTLIPITWLFVTVAVSVILLALLSTLLIKYFNLASKWHRQFLCSREQANNRGSIITTQRDRLNRTLKAIREISFISKGTEFEERIKEICHEAAKIPPDDVTGYSKNPNDPTYEYQGKNPNEVDELRDQALKKIAEEDKLDKEGFSGRAIRKKKEFGDPNDSCAGGSCT